MGRTRHSGYRYGDQAQGLAPTVRTVLYAQADGEGVGLGHRLSHRGGPRGADPGFQRGGAWHHSHREIARARQACRKGGGMTPEAEILIVDDEVNIRSALVTILEKRGHRVVAVGSGEDAWAFMQRTPVDLILTDLKLPGMGGIELLRRVKNGVPETEVVVMTAYGSVETAVEAMRLGAYDYVTKPIEKERFPVVVEKALERRRRS